MGQQIARMQHRFWPNPLTGRESKNTLIVLKDEIQQEYAEIRSLGSLAQITDLQPRDRQHGRRHFAIRGDETQRIGGNRLRPGFRQHISVPIPTATVT